jgi:hypothetical protein
MVHLRKYCNLPANSILESVIALTIISICLAVAVTVYAAVFNPRTSVGSYNKQNEINEMFFLLQVKKDSLSEDSGFVIKSETHGNLTEYNIAYPDSTKTGTKKHFYILPYNE